MTAAIWSTPPDKCALDFPAKTLVRPFCAKYGLTIAHNAHRSGSSPITICCKC